MKKYVILKKDGETSLPIIDKNDNRAIKELKNKGYKIIGRIKSESDFEPKFARKAE